MRRISIAFATAAAILLTAPSAGAVPRRPRPTPTPSRGRTPIRAAHTPLTPGDRISLDLKDADIRDVIRTFAQLARLNVVIDPEVKGSVTVRLYDVRWEDALDVILRSNGLGAVREDNLRQVAAPAKLAGEAER